MKRLLLFLNIIIAIPLLKAQQYPLFTNYVLNDFGFNPAIAGSTEYIDMRLTYRTQWTGIEGAPQTQIVSAQGALKALPMGVGGYLYNDVAGQIKRTGVSAALCYGYDVGIGKLGLGAAAGFYSFRLNDNSIVENGTDPTLADAMDGTWTPEFSVGTYLTLKNGAYIGFSIPQVLKQKINFDSDQNGVSSDLVPHYYAMAGYRLKVNEKLSLEPSVLLKITEAAPLQIDGSIRAIMNEKFWIGGSYRTQDAASAMIGYDVSRRMSIAYAYDFTLSTLREGSKGSHEFSVALRLGGPKDKDGDGVYDEEDECPEEPGPAENNGCPEEEEDLLSDRDKDGILDPNDACPDEPGPKDNDGCPYGDRDKDGVRDEIDQCPEVPGLPELKGCPVDDRDGDGILDAADRCPDQRGSLQNQGCPVGDADGDGVEDMIDKCPNTPGTVERNGCPQVTDEERDILDLAIRNLYFDTDKDKIRSSAFKYLDKLAELMVSRPDWKVYMAGHTDDRGSEEYNVDLSKRRVESVLFYLMNRGVSRSQLVTEYYGEIEPAESNSSEQKRQLNRRVEMRFIWD